MNEAALFVLVVFCHRLGYIQRLWGSGLCWGHIEDTITSSHKRPVRPGVRLENNLKTRYFVTFFIEQCSKYLIQQCSKYFLQKCSKYSSLHTLRYLSDLACWALKYLLISLLKVCSVVFQKFWTCALVNSFSRLSSSSQFSICM